MIYLLLILTDTFRLIIFKQNIYIHVIYYLPYCVQTINAGFRIFEILKVKDSFDKT